MDILSFKNVSYFGPIGPGLFDDLVDFSYEFHYGKSYLLNGCLGQGAWAVSWLVAEQ